MLCLLGLTRIVKLTCTLLTPASALSSFYNTLHTLLCLVGFFAHLMGSSPSRPAS